MRLDVPGQGRGTDFFGIPLNPASIPSPGLEQVAPDGAPAGISVGALDSVATPTLSMASASVSEGVSLVSSGMTEFQAGVVKNGAEFARDVAKEMLKKIITLSLPTSVVNAERMVEYEDKMHDFITDLFQTLDTQRLVGILANGSPNDYLTLQDELDRIQRKAAGLGVPDNPLSDTEMETGYKLLNHKDLSAGDVVKIAGDRFKGYLSEKWTQHLFSGGM